MRINPWILIVTVLAVAHPAAGEELPSVEPSPLVSRVIDDPLTSDEQRDALRVFHGRWDDLNVDELDPRLAAQLALLRYDLDSPVLTENEGADPLIAAAAALHRGTPRRVLEALDGVGSAQAALLRAEAHEQLGDLPAAVAELRPWRDRLYEQDMDDAAELTAAARGLVVLARLEGRPAQDYQLALNLLAKVRTELDPLYWPAYIAEARILLEKDNRPETVEAFAEALTLNPMSSEAYYLLGIMSVQGYNFDRAEAVAERLDEIQEGHVLGKLLMARSYLQQKDAERASAVITQVLAQYPGHREAAALRVGAESIAYDPEGVAAAIEDYEALAPGHPQAFLTLGQVLTRARQYEDAEAALREAIRRQPNASAPRIELGLLLVQAGKLEEARRELADASRLDPFNRRAANTLTVVEDLLTFNTIETDHFIIRYAPGVDAALAHDMPLELEGIYRDITSAYGFKPPFKTQIDLMPDEKSFGVRITGMPDIWTIAAATGPAISLTPPREGAKQRGPFDWPNVIRHEFVHTVTLTQTNNRIPHWFTEACAVSQEVTGRLYENCMLLAWAANNDELIAYDDLNWAFIRPTKPTDRPLAYAQSEWILEYITQTRGYNAVLEMLNLYRDGVPEREVLEKVTGQTPEAFMNDFRAWAQEQVKTWGLHAIVTGPRAAAIISGESEPENEAELDALLDTYPDHPDLLRLKAERAMADPLRIGAREAVWAYAAARPVDPWPHKMLVALAVEDGDLTGALSSLEALDQVEQTSGDYAHQLAKLYRAADRLDEAMRSAERALHREPYNASFRQLAATVALQRRDMQRGLEHLEALALIEPDRSIHFVRLAALHHRLGNAEATQTNAAKARELDPEAPVERFLP